MVNDGVSTFKSTPYGQKSLALGDSAYRTFAAPVLPYLARPLQYVAPYVKRADALGAQTLAKVDERFPVVKKSTGEIIDDAKAAVLLPVRIGQSGKEHILSTYDAEVKKVGGDGYVSYGKAALTTVLVLTTETLATVTSFLGNQKENSRQVIDEKTSSN